MATKKSHLAVAVIVAAIAAVLFYQYRQFFHDDAYISLRYAQTFLNGGGLCWNPGERVEGYTNFLYVILVAALGRFGIDLEFGARLIGILAYAGLTAFAIFRHRSIQQSNKGSWYSFIPIVLCATALPVLIWTVGGLETTLFTLLVTIGTVKLGDALAGHKDSLYSAGILMGLATLCRPDGILFVLIGLIMLVAKALIVDRHFDRRVWWYLFGAAVLTVPHEIWRYFYYGHWLPNTFLIKGTHLGEASAYGWQYLNEFSAGFPFLPYVLLVGAVVATVARAWHTRSIWYSLMIVSFGGYVVAIGGDHMPAFRLFAPLIPLCGFLIYEWCVSAQQFQLRYMQLAMLALVLILCAGQAIFPAEKYQRAKVRDGAAFLGEQIGNYINANWSEGSLVALNTAGSTPYFAPKLRFIDMLGLNDTTIAQRHSVPLRTKMQEWPGHRKGDGLYVLSRKPDYVIIGPSNGDYANNFPWFLSDYELGGSEEFAREYQPAKVIIPVSDIGYEDYAESSLGALRFVYYQRRR